MKLKDDWIILAVLAAVWAYFLFMLSGQVVGWAVFGGLWAILTHAVAVAWGRRNP